jgi:hypothetical protein
MTLPVSALRRLIIVSLLVTLPLGVRVIVAAPAMVGQHLPSILQIIPSNAVPGAVVTINAPAGSFAANAIAAINFQDVTNSYAGIPIGRAQTAADGSLNVVVTLPLEAAPGPDSVFVTVNGVTSSSTVIVGPTISLSTTMTPAGSSIQVVGAGFKSDNTVSFTVDGQPAGILGNELVICNLYGSFVALILVPGNVPQGMATLVASDGETSTSTSLTIAPAFSQPVPLPTASATSTPTATTAGFAAYFAEGYTGQASATGNVSFSESLNILNVGASSNPITITYFLQGSAPITVNRTVPATSVLRESVNTDVGPNQLVAASIQSSGLFSASRTIDRVTASGQRLDSSATTATAAPALSWAFPEGYTGSTFQEYLTILNPSSSQATVKVSLAPESIATGNPTSVQLIVPPMSRATSNIRALNLGSSANSVGLLISSDQPIVPERVEYFGAGQGSAKFGSTVSSGFTTPANELRIAYGSSAPGGDQSFITILNPGAQTAPITVTATLTGAAGSTIGHLSTVSLTAGTRKTIAASTLLGNQRSSPFSVLLQATGPIDAEEAQYFGGSPNVGSHAGVVFPASAVGIQSGYFSDLSTGLDDGTAVRRTVYLYNPGNTPERITLTYFGVSGQSTNAGYVVPAGGITAVDVAHDTQPVLPAGPLGATVSLAPGSTGFFLAWSVGATAGNTSVTESVAVGS